MPWIRSIRVVQINLCRNFQRTYGILWGWKGSTGNVTLCQAKTWIQNSIISVFKINRKGAFWVYSILHQKTCYYLNSIILIECYVFLYQILKNSQLLELCSCGIQRLEKLYLSTHIKLTKMILSTYEGTSKVHRKWTCRFMKWALRIAVKMPPHPHSSKRKKAHINFGVVRLDSCFNSWFWLSTNAEYTGGSSGSSAALPAPDQVPLQPWILQTNQQRGSVCVCFLLS